MQPSSSSASTLHLAIDGMSCGHCVAAVKDALAELPGVHVERVAIGEATVALTPGAPTVDALVEAVRDAGYEARVAEPAPRRLPQL